MSFFPRKRSKPPWASYCRDAADGAGTLQLSASEAFAPTRNSPDVAGPVENDVVAMLVGLEVGVSGHPAVGTTRDTAQSAHRIPWAAVALKPSSHPAREGM